MSACRCGKERGGAGGYEAVVSRFWPPRAPFPPTSPRTAAFLSRDIAIGIAKSIDSGVVPEDAERATRSGGCDWAGPGDTFGLGPCDFPPTNPTGPTAPSDPTGGASGPVVFGPSGGADPAGPGADPNPDPTPDPPDDPDPVDADDLCARLAALGMPLPEWCVDDTGDPSDTGGNSEGSGETGGPGGTGTGGGGTGGGGTGGTGRYNT